MHGNSCRICLEGDETNLADLFGYEEAENPATKLVYCAGIEVFENDQLPQKICFECLQKLEIAFEFKEKSLSTDQLLRMQLKDEPKEVEPQIEIKVDSHPAEWVSGYGEYESSNYVQTKQEEYLSGEEAVHEEYLAEYIPIYHPKPTSKPKTPRTPFKRSQADFQKAKAEDYNCVFCEKTFKKLVEKKKHVKIDHSDELKCRVCHKHRGSVLATERCIRDHQYGFLFLCQICARPFNRKYLLDKHIEEIHNDNRIMFGCDLCGAKIRHKNSLQRHMRTVHTDERIPCPYTDLCPDVLYTTKNSLRIHLYRVHDAPAPLSCKNCASGFSNATELNAHMKYGCRILSKPETQKKAYNSFQARGSLQQYYNIVDGNFHCKLCTKVHVSKKNFSDHFQNYHKDNKTCKICNKTFNQFNTFRMHVKVVHEKVKNYVCDYPGCGKTFGRGHGLNVHRNTHTGEKPYSCPFCSYRTGDNATLCKHKKKMHSNVQLEALYPTTA